MKKRVYFILSSLKAGGSERVFWLLSQYFDKSVYDVSLILLDSRDPFFSPRLHGIRIVDLKTIKVSRSFFKLYHLIKTEKPHAIFTTGGHINALLSILSLFVKIPFLIGREASFIEVMVGFEGRRAKILDKFIGATYKRMNKGVCQSEELRTSLADKYGIPLNKLIVIPNPVIPTEVSRVSVQDSIKRIVIVARLAVEKGLFRLLDIMKDLPPNYHLSIAGNGPLREDIIGAIDALGLSARVKLVGQVADVTGFISRHDLMVLTSFTEGFPNAVVESLSVGIPVVSYRVSGIAAIIKNGFNGYIIEQDKAREFGEHIIKACNKNWETMAIKDDVIAKFGIQKVVARYENLIA